MTHVPYMRMYWEDFLADTNHLTNEQLGAYTRLLGHSWPQGGRFPVEDDAYLQWACHCTPQRLRTLKPVLMGFMIDNGDGSATQKRMSKERSWSLFRSEQARQAAEKRWKPNSKKNNGMAHANAYAGADANASANAMQYREDINNLDKYRPHTSVESSTADAAGANPAGPPAIPVSDKLLATKIFRNPKGH